MRKVFFLALLVSPIALAESVSVETHSLLRLPNSTSVLQLERLVADERAQLQALRFAFFWDALGGR